MSNLRIIMFTMCITLAIRFVYMNRYSFQDNTGKCFTDGSYTFLVYNNNGDYIYWVNHIDFLLFGPITNNNSLYKMDQVKCPKVRGDMTGLTTKKLQLKGVYKDVTKYIDISTTD